MNAYGFMPHGYCFEWRPSVLWLHVLSDFSIGISYYCIPFVLFYFIRKRPDLPFRPVFWLIGSFILLCGTTHFLNIWVLWHADYYVEGIVKAMTAVVSVATLIAVFVVLPRALGQRSVADMAEAGFQLQGLVASSADAIMTKTLDGIVTSWNAAAEKVFGYSEREMIGQPMTRIIPPDRVDEEAYILNEIRNGRTVARYETIRQKKTGELISISMTVSPIRNSSGTVIGASKIARDNTERKTAEAATARHYIELAESAEHAAQSDERSRVTLKAVVDNAVDGIITIGEDGRITSYNAACTAIFGYTLDEVMGKNLKMLMPEPYHGEHDGYLSSYITTGNAKIIGTSGREVKALRKDRSVFPMDLSVSSFTVDGVRYFSGIVRDITKQKQMEDNRERLLVQLTDSNTELERFAYVASHDMQEPLRMVLNFTQVIVRKYADVLDEEGKEYLQIVSNSAGRMRAMVHDLLEYARLGREGMSLSDVNLELELSHVRANLMEIIAETKAVITSGELPTIRGSAVQLMRLLQNLTANAIKYQPPDQIPVIHIGASRENDFWLFSVRDNGLGIDAAFIKEIFEPYRRLHHWESIKGTGLGLAVCKKIVENHGGRIWAVSTPGASTTIFFTLPVTEPQPTNKTLGAVP